MDKKYGIWAEMVLEKSIETYRRNDLMAKIDKALDQKDYESFTKWTAELKNLEKQPS
jgi:uncharacterized protein YpiB (UPF0302 family)